MISDAAYTALRTAVSQGRYSPGVFSTALRLYKDNYDATQRSSAGMTKAQIEALLLIPTNVKSLIEQSEREFKDNARKALFSERAGRSFSDAAWNIALNIIGNIIFIAISIIAYLSMQDAAKNAFHSLGFDVRPSIEGRAEQPQRALPPPAPR